MTAEQLRAIVDAAAPEDRFRVTLRRNTVQDVMVLDGTTGLNRTGDDIHFQVLETAFARPVGAILRIDRLG